MNDIEHFYKNYKQDNSAKKKITKPWQLHAVSNQTHQG